MGPLPGERCHYEGSNDHQSLRYLKTMKLPTKRLALWIASTRTSLKQQSSTKLGVLSFDTGTGIIKRKDKDIDSVRAVNDVCVFHHRRLTRTSSHIVPKAYHRRPGRIKAQGRHRKMASKARTYRQHYHECQKTAVIRARGHGHIGTQPLRKNLSLTKSVKLRRPYWYHGLQDQIYRAESPLSQLVRHEDAFPCTKESRAAREAETQEDPLQTESTQYWIR